MRAIDIDMSIYDDDDAGAEGGGDIYSGSDELVVPDWDVSKGGGDAAASGAVQTDQVVVLCVSPAALFSSAEPSSKLPRRARRPRWAASLSSGWPRCSW